MANELKIKKSDLKALFNEVELELQELIKNEGERLSKAGSDNPEDNSEGSMPAEGPSPDLNGDGAIGEASASPDASPAATPTGAEASAPAPGAEGSGDIASDTSPEALQADYEQLSDEELKNHFLACKAAIMGRMGGGAGDEASAGAPPGAPPGGPPAPEASAPAPMAMAELGAEKPAPSPPPPSPNGAAAGAAKPGGLSGMKMSELVKDMVPSSAPLKAPTPAPSPSTGPKGPEAPAPAAPVGKKEFGAGHESGGEMTGGKMGKSESNSEVAELKRQLAEQAELLQKQEAGLMKLCEVVAAPMRKSVKGLSDLAFVPKTDVKEDKPKLTKTEAVSKLRDVARSTGLKKADRELINGFCAGDVKYEQIEHLLADAK